MALATLKAALRHSTMVTCWLEPHRVEWAIQEGRLYVLEVGTVRVSGVVKTRAMWVDATDWDRHSIRAWLGY